MSINFISVPLGVVHCTSEPVEFRGYLIPEETFIFVNMTESMFNEKDYPESTQFKPERWLSQDGKKLIKEFPKSFMPFGIG